MSNNPIIVDQPFILRKEKDASRIGSVSPSRLSVSQSQKTLGTIGDHSASTLQHAVPVWTFSKADRFPRIKHVNHSPSYIIPPSTITHKATSIGYGHKIIMSEINSKHSGEFPGPNQYSPKQWTEGENKGKTFGLSYASYRKVYNPHADVVLPDLVKDYPGPGAYHRNEDPKRRSRQFSMRGRGKMCNDTLTCDVPASNHYFPNVTLVNSGRYKSPSFTQSRRSDFTKEGSLSPGPGAYALSSKFDKMHEKKLIMEKVRERIKLMRVNTEH